MQGQAKLRSAIAAVLIAAGSTALADSVAAQAYPNKPVALVVPFPAGGPSDTLGRLMADHLSRSLGQRVIVENVSGAGGVVGTERAANAAPDGYTLLTHHSGLPAAASLYSNLRYDSKEAFEPLALINTGPMVLISKKTLEAKDAKELFAWMKANGERAKIGFAGVGSNSYICAILLQQLLDAKLTMAGYRGTRPAMKDLVDGQIDILCDQATTAVPQIEAGTVKAYAVTSADRLASLKDVPSAREAGLPNFNVTIWNGLYAPKGVPKEIAEQVNAAIGKMLVDPVIIEWFAATGTVAFPPDMRSPAAHAKFLASQFDRFEKMFEAAGVKPAEAK